MIAPIVKALRAFGNRQSREFDAAALSRNDGVANELQHHVTGRGSASGITLFKLLGIAVEEDVATAHATFERSPK